MEHVTVRFGRSFTAVDDVSFGVDEGKLLCLLGPSGCGKTTTLRVIAGFVTPDQGKVTVGGRDFTRLPVHKRHLGLVFQNYALFPHLTVAENVAFGLRMRRWPQAKLAARVQEMLELVDLPSLGGRMVTQLSGGQQQRVALARALAIEPEVLLLDEPLSNLDALLRLRMRAELKRIQQKLGVTAVFVTHDQEECFAVADEVIVLNRGRIVQQGTPREVFERPRTRFVAEFVGFENLFRMPEGQEVAARAEDVALDGPADGDGLRLSGRVELVTAKGRRTLLVVRTNQGELQVLLPEGRPAPAPGEEARLFIPDVKLVRLEA
ncbi:MAG TPA: ABC transporter ATP-binding protein [Firmicutes bacterium]|nr:ABC transporter ATP-binding protein [Bacillota bacterium]